MPKKIKLFLNSEQKVSKVIFGVLMVGLAVLVAGNGAFAYFQREASDSIFQYGYGFGGNDYGYGYGYGYGADVSDFNDYGFWETDSQATSLSAVQSGSSRLVVGYTTGYYAKNKVYYGATNTTCASLGSNTTQTAFETGANSVTISDLTCATTYYYCVASTDSGANTWYTSVASAATGACGSGSGPSGGYVAPIIPATTTVATTTVTTTTITTGDTTVTKSISQMTVTELRSKIKEIMNLLIGLLSQMIGQWQIQLQAMVTGQSAPTTLNVNLKYGDTGDGVKLLQTWLAKDTTIYPTGVANGTFGPATKAAVIKFQEKYKAEILTPAGLANGTGLVGASTRAKLNSLYGSQ